MRTLSELAHHLNAMRHDHLSLSARDVHYFSEGELTPATLEAALTPLLNRPGFTFRLWDEYRGQAAVMISRPTDIRPDWKPHDVPEEQIIDTRMQHWEEHMNRFIKAHDGQPQGRILIELERRESWAKMMPHLADILDPPELR